MLGITVSSPHLRWNPVPRRGTPYFEAFTDAWEQIACDLSRCLGERIHVHRNYSLGCIDMREPGGDTVVIVVVSGEHCIPTAARIVSNLERDLHGIFRRTLEPRLRVTFEYP